MKLLILVLLTSCTLRFPQRTNTVKVPKKVKYQDKLKSCVTELIGDFGVKAEAANKVCRDIYGSKQ